MDKKDRSSKMKMSKDKVEPLGKNVFSFFNSDVYVGEYKATKKEEIFRQGYGKYFCDDGSVYGGTWNTDYLENATYLAFPNNDVFIGSLKNFQYSGYGFYSMSRVGTIETSFENNYPAGEMLLTDPYGFHWKGYANKESSETILYPVNHFKITFDDIDEGSNNIK